MNMDSKHSLFTEWAEEHGVQINGVSQAVLPGKGIGIVATRRLKKGEAIVTIPASALITHDSDFVRTSGIGKGTVYGTVAASLCLNHENEERWYRTWQDVWPSREDFETSMPLCWSVEDRDLLPDSAKALLKHQEDKYEKDWSVVQSKIPENLWDWFKYYWLIVNTRCFYWVYFKKAKDASRRGKKLPRDECLALVPWGDYFNHSDKGCQVQESEKGATVICDRIYKKGEEVVTSYGAHNNDYLLVEYGFILAENAHDCSSIDSVVLGLLRPAQYDFLDESGYLGDYWLTADGLCYRTQVAIRAMVTTPKKMQSFLDGEYDGKKEQHRVEELTQEVFMLLRKNFEAGLQESSKLLKASPMACTVRTRWQQLLNMLSVAELKISNEEY